MTKKLKVLHIINNLKIGGAEKILITLLKELSKRKDLELYVVSLEGHGDLIKDIPKNVEVKEFHYKLFSSSVKSRLDLFFRSKLFEYVAEIDPDIIHGHLIKGEDFAKVLGGLLHKPVIITSHDSLIYPGRKVKFLNRFITKDVAVSEGVAKHLNEIYGLGNDKIQVIPNTIDVEEFIKGKKKFNPNKPVFIYIGRLLKSKGIEHAMSGLAKLQQDYPNLEFLIYGKAGELSYQKHLEKVISKNKWGFIKLMGKTDDVPNALKKGDIFVLPSKSEGFAISVLEAAAASKPIIATDTGAIAQIAQNGRSGEIIEWNKPEQIYRAGKKILDENLVEKYGNCAHQIAEQFFDVKQIGEKYYELYRESSCDKI